MRAKVLAVCLIVGAFIVVAGAAYCFAGNIRLAKAQSELARSQELVADLARVNEVERGRLDYERRAIDSARTAVIGERNRIAQERIELARARESFEAERKRLAGELEAYTRIDGILDNSFEIIRRLEAKP